MNAFRLRPEAEADLAAIAVYVTRERSVESAKKLVTRLRERCRILNIAPLAGRPRPDIGEALRSFTEPPYIIFYTITKDVPEVVAFIHGARDLPAVMAARRGD